MKIRYQLLAVSLLLALTVTTTFAGASRPPEVYGQKHYGIVVAMPKDRIGIWNITGERVEVVKETAFDEARGKAETGAFVEVTGKKVGTLFKAYTIEVKLPKKE